MGIKLETIKVLAGAETGKAALLFDMPGAGEVSVASGILLAPTPSVWSMFPWKLEVIEVCQNYQLSVKLLTGFVTFSDIAGTPAARFGTGIGDPGYQANVATGALSGIAYGLNNPGAVDIVQAGNTSNRPMEISASGEITVWYTNNTGYPAYAKAVLTVGAEAVLPFPPYLVP
jgi:hypothetical protein